MAAFQLYLLTPNINSNRYYVDLISCFQDQTSSFRFKKNHKIGNTVNNDLILPTSFFKEESNHSFNEKLSLGLNAQKTFSFDMPSRIMKNNNWIRNVFVDQINIGSMLLLKDKYEKYHVFIVKQISIQLSDINTIYSYTCQDAFSYTMTRQNEGYFINNDPTSLEFIGAQTLDWWMNKINSECYISDTYVQINKSIFKTNQNNIWITNNKYFTGLNEKSEGIVEIIKDSDEDMSLKTFSFSCDGSSALNAILSLAELVNYSLSVYEHVIFEQEGCVSIRRYYWLQPTKIETATPYLYSPKKNIENFSLDYAGESLTTILNVKTHQIADENVSLLPITPARFSDWFQSNNWKESVFEKSFYSNLLNGIDWTSEGDNPTLTTDIDDNEIITKNGNEVWIRLIDLRRDDDYFPLTWWDTKVKFSLSSGKISYFYVEESTNEVTQLVVYSSKSFPCKLKLLLPEEEEGEAITIKEGEEIPEKFRGQNVIAYLAFDWIWDDDNIKFYKKPDINLYFYSDVTKNEEEFAALADKMPWLENKIIDFNYFLDNEVISLNEYQELMSKINNDLRIVNGQLLCYAKEYYNSLKTKVELIADLENYAENLHAELEAEGITPYGKTGSTNKLSNFITQYSSLNTLYKNQQEIYGASEIQNDYFNKYFKAQQRFLKNIYEFIRYFNTPVSSKLKSLHEYSLELIPKASNSNYFTFNTTGLTLAQTPANPNLSYYIKEGSGENYKQIAVVHKGNYKDFYINQLSTSELVSVTDSFATKEYKEDFTYLLKESASIGDIDFSSATQIIIDNNKYYILNKTLLKQIYYSLLKDKWKDLTTTTTVNLNIRNFSSFEELTAATTNIPSTVYLENNREYKPIQYQDPNGSNFNAYYLDNLPITGLFENDYDFYLNTGGYESYFKTDYNSSAKYYISPAACLESLKALKTEKENYDNAYKHRVATSYTLTPEKSTTPIPLYVPYLKLKQITNNQTTFAYDVYATQEQLKDDSSWYCQNTLVRIPANTPIKSLNGIYLYELINYEEKLFDENTFKEFFNQTAYKDNEEFNPFIDTICGKKFFEICDNNNLYYVTELKNNYVSPDGNYSSETVYYKKENDGSFSSAVNIENIGANKYYVNKNSISFYDWGEILIGEEKTISTSVYLHQVVGDYEVVKKYPYSFDVILPITSVIKKDNNDNEYEELGVSIENQELTIKHDDIEYTSKLTASSQNETRSEGIPKNNGSFWATYIDSEQKIYREKALMIEEQLTEYWMQAYSASKYCDFFIPETWTSKFAIEKNYFYNQLFYGANTDLKISTTFIPQVGLVLKDGNSKLPAYQITYDKYDENIEAGVSANIEDGSNLAFQDLAINLLGLIDEMKSFKLKPTGATTSYYYIKEGGMRWKDLVHMFNSTKSSLAGFSGLYGLMFKWSTSFIENEFSTYKQLANKKEEIWKQLHNLYPHLFFEGVFEYPTATTSQELYDMASYYFKEKSKPEINYSITVLDPHSLKGYQGEELKIGYPILIDATEYPLESLKVKKSIDQYLFITDINYSLRSDTNINITVNSIKYDDKLIQKLAKLIR